VLASSNSALPPTPPAPAQRLPGRWCPRGSSIRSSARKPARFSNGLAVPEHRAMITAIDYSVKPAAVPSRLAGALGLICRGTVQWPEGDVRTDSSCPLPDTPRHAVGVAQPNSPFDPLGPITASAPDAGEALRSTPPDGATRGTDAPAAHTPDGSRAFDRTGAFTGGAPMSTLTTARPMDNEVHHRSAPVRVTVHVQGRAGSRMSVDSARAPAEFSSFDSRNDCVRVFP
jgi:hypothetical protein